MKRIISLILTAALLLSVFVVSAGAEGSGKSITVAIPSDPSFTVDAIGDSNGLTINLVREGLTRQGQGGVLSPNGVAESYEHNEDYTQWTFHLRDAAYQDGTPVTADDFVFAIAAQLDGTVEVSYPDFLYEIKNARGVVRGTASVEELGVRAIDDKTVVFETEYPVTYFPQLITHPMHFGYSRRSRWAMPTLAWSRNTSSPMAPTTSTSGFMTTSWCSKRTPITGTQRISPSTKSPC